MKDDFIYKIAQKTDLEFTDEIEKQALPIIDPYYKNNIDIFTNEIEGDLIIVYDKDYPVGMGRYSFHPDGTMWLETVRVRPDYQRRGIGQGIYENYLKKAQENNIKTIRLYTEGFNEKSMALTKKMGYKIVYKYDYFSLNCQNKKESTDFKTIKDINKIMKIIEKNPWQDLICINNVFYEQNKENISWFMDRDMVYIDDSYNLMILGARHNRNSVAYIGYMCGDYEKIINASKSLASNKTLSIGISKNETKLQKYFKDFEKRYDLIVSEKKL